MIVQKEMPYLFMIDKDGIAFSGKVEYLFYKSQLIKIKEACEKTIELYDNNNINDDNIYEENQKQLEKECRLLKYGRYERETFIYIMKDENTGYYKIGRSVNPKKRERTLQSEKPTITLIFSARGLVEEEITLHNRYKDTRIRGEWFSLQDYEVQDIISYLTIKEKKLQRRNMI